MAIKLGGGGIKTTSEPSEESEGFFGSVYSAMSSRTLNLPTILDSTSGIVEGAARSVRESALDVGRQVYNAQESIGNIAEQTGRLLTTKAGEGESMVSAVSRAVFDTKSVYRTEKEKIKNAGLSAALDAYKIGSDVVGVVGAPIIGTAAAVAPDTFETFAEWMNKGENATVDYMNDSSLSLNAKKASFQLATDVGIATATLGVGFVAKELLGGLKYMKKGKLGGISDVDTMTSNIDEAVNSTFKPVDSSIVTPQKFQDFLVNLEDFEKNKGRNANTFDVENIFKETTGKSITLEPIIDVRKISKEAITDEPILRAQEELPPQKAKEEVARIEKVREEAATSSRKVIDEAIDEPNTIGETLSVLDEGKTRAPAAKTLYKKIKEDYVNLVGDKVPETFRKNVEMLAEKAGIEVRSLKSWDGVIDMNAVDDAMKKFADSSKDNFKYGTKLPIPKTLNKMLRRDEAVAANAFKEGKRTATYNAELAKQSKQAFQDSVFNTINSLTKKEGNLYPFYGTKKEINEIAGAFKKQISEVDSTKKYNELVEQMGRAIEVKNRNILDNKIRSRLKNYFRAETPGTAKKKPITPNERMMLEAVARGYDHYAKTADTEMLKTTLDALDMVEKLGKGKLKEVKIVTEREIAREVEKVKEEGIHSVFKESISKENSFKKLTKGFHYLFIDIYRIANQALDGNLEGTMGKRITATNEARNVVAEINSDFQNYIAENLHGTKWQGMSELEKLGEYMTLKQDDFNKYIFDEDGTFIGNKVFPEKYDFKDITEFNKYKKELFDEVESSPEALDAIQFSRLLIEDTYELARAVDLAYDGSMRNRIGNYYSATRANHDTTLEFKDNIFEQHAKDFDKGSQKSRTYRDDKGKLVGFAPNFAVDMNRFINRQVRYAHSRPAYEALNNLYKGGALDDLNRFTQKAFKQILVDTARPEIMPFTIVNAIMGQLSVAALGFNLSPVIKQALVLPDALVYLDSSDIAFGVKNSLNKDLIDSARKHSSALRRSYGMDYTFNDIQAYTRGPGTAAKTLKYVNKVGMFLMEKADASTKFNVWAGAYFKKMKEVYPGFEEGMIKEFNNPQAVAYANEIMQRVASSKDVSRVPLALRNTGGQLVLQLQSTLRNRYGLITSDLPLAWKKDPMRGLAAATGIAASTVTEILIGPALKVLYKMTRVELGLQDNLGKGEDEKYLEAFQKSLFGSESPEVRDIVNTLFWSVAKQVPGLGNFNSIVNYGGTGIQTADAMVKAFSTAAAATDNVLEGEYFNALANMIKGGSTFVGGNLVRTIQSATGTEPLTSKQLEQRSKGTGKKKGIKSGIGGTIRKTSKKKGIKI